MRLLHLTDEGNLNLTENLSENAILPYAILSHTWGADAEEVTFEDLKNNDGREKIGYKKILFCGNQARRDGLQYFWVDTCCINKANKGEISYAINSMFNWYRDSARCYVYLPDVDNATRQPVEQDFKLSTWASEFNKSRWFTRGWTLQELLASKSVEFFDRNWERLGDKASLQQQIHEITGIPYTALRGTPLTQFDIEERLSWNVHRHTKLEEDRVYSLLGIFDVYISPFYGEGASRARERLMGEIKKRNQCIEDLRVTDPRHDKKRIEGTKGGLLKDSYRWILSNTGFQQWREQSNRLLWIKGDPGKGKTMLLCGIIDELKTSKENTSLLAYFFCQATDSRTNSATAVLRGLLYMLVDQQPSLAKHILKKHDHAGKSLFEDVNAWIALTEMFSNIICDPRLSSACLIIDALDECIAEGDLAKLLGFIAQHSNYPRVKWLVSSRNWPEIEEQFQQAGQKVKLSLELNADSISIAVGNFIDQKVAQLVKRKKYDHQTEIEVRDYLALNANDTFLWVALVCQSLENVPRWAIRKKLHVFPPGLDQLYGQMLQQIISSDFEDLCKQILAFITIVYRPLTLRELASLIEPLEDINEDLESIREVMALCRSFLTVREDVVYFVHQSAKDFLSVGEAANVVFPCGNEAVHRTIFLRSLHIMSKTLRRDIYGQRDLGFSIKQIERPDPVPDPLAASRYSCIYWIDHWICHNVPLIWNSSSCDNWLDDWVAIARLIKERYVYWLEASSLCHCISQIASSMTQLDNLAKLSNPRVEDIDLCELISDAQRFLMAYKVAIENYPLQVYASALLFSPTKSFVRQYFRQEQPRGISLKLPKMDGWGSCLQTLEGHGHSICSVSFSNDARWLASGSADQTVKIWEVNSGACLQTLVHGDLVDDLKFSPNSTKLVSRSMLRDIKLWDINEGICLKTVDNYAGSPPFTRSLVFMHLSDTNELALGWSNGLLDIEDLNRGIRLLTLGHDDDDDDDDDGMTIWDFSENRDQDEWYSASARDRTIKIWKMKSMECLHTLHCHSGCVGIKVSSDSRRLASMSTNYDINIWSVSSGDCQQVSNIPYHYHSYLLLSHRLTQLITAEVHFGMKLWNVGEGMHLQTLEGHRAEVISADFSLDEEKIATASYDHTVKIWDTKAYLPSQEFVSHLSSVNSMVFSDDCTRLASASDDRTIKIWDVGTGLCLKTLIGHQDRVLIVIFSHDSAWLVSGSADERFKIWDTTTGACLHTREVEWGYGQFVTISRDTELVGAVAGSNGSQVKIWHARSGTCLQTLDAETGHSLEARVHSLAFSQDSTLIASGSKYGTVMIWDLKTRACVTTIQGNRHWVQSLVFSHDSTLIASNSGERVVNIWDTKTGKCLVVAKGVLSQHLAFDPTGSYLYTNHGTIAATPSPLSMTPVSVEVGSSEHQPGHVSLDKSWIIRNNKRTLWIPSEYRPGCIAISGKHIAIGVGSGKVWICSFD